MDVPADNMRYRFNKKVFLFRSYISLAFLISIVLLVFFRVYDLQILKYEYYKNKASRQYKYSTEFYDRGSIYLTDKDGRLISAATIKDGANLALVPALFDKSKTDEVYDFLNKTLGLDIDYYTFSRKAAKVNDPYEELLKKIDTDTAKKIKERNIKGLITPYHRWRYYPGADLAAHVLGFVARKDDNDELHGRYGLEKMYDDYLFRDSKKMGVNFFAELFLQIKYLISDKEHFNASLVTSIDPTVQEKLETVLKKTAKRWSSKRVSAIVYNPNNGEIVAMASYPNFDLNKYYLVDDISVYNNPLVEDVFEMGSIMKAITVASGIDSGVIHENDKYNDTGVKIYDGSKIYNYDKRARGPGTPVQEILSQSLNIGAAWVYERMGKGRFRDYFKKFGLLEESGVDLPNEAAPLVSNLYSPRDIEYATASFGQGIAVSPISMVRALGALATGVLQRPHTVKKIIYDNGFEKDYKYESDAVQVLKKSSTETIARMLTEVVDKKLDHGKRKKEHYTVAAKTGTAQVGSGHGTYIKEVYNHTFFGYFPAFDPRFVVLFVNERPHGAKYASQTLTDPFYEMLDFLINYYNIKPDR